MAAAKQGSADAAQGLRVDPLPKVISPIWNAFIAMHDARGSNGHAPNAITWQDIAAWQQVSGNALTPWELDTIRAIDGVAMAAFAKQAKAQQAQNKGT